jgi:hypothetical protein
MSIKPVHKLVAASVLAFAASASQAAVVTEWDFALSMQWNTSPGATKFSPGIGGFWEGTGRTDVSSTVISWGSSWSSPGTGYHHRDPTYARSGLVINPSQQKGTISTSFEGGPVETTKANMFTHYNSAISGAFKSLERATLDVAIQVILPGFGNVVENISKSFEIHFYETPNTGLRCAWGLCDDDIFAVVSGMDLTSTFKYAGIEYTLNYFEVSNHLKPLSDTTCKVMGFAGGHCYGFTTPENKSTVVEFNFSITAGPIPVIPEPETYAMMLAGLGIVGAVVRRRRNTFNN